MDILKLKMEENDAEAETVGEYLQFLLILLLNEQEGFSGKRPFGNSGWIGDLAIPLVKNGVITGTIDSDGYIEDYSESELIMALVEALGKKFS